ncbi:glycosyltransferase [Actinocrinis puniceicyclus]|uniref:Glycosyltransferase n=1 Tax=Actinocrinis puniceicyclus TaxID=977794 RepID=A0A8J7WJH3_9ACTN|nr:glycosyltransferase [Actinocrinis puniceicyclus]MBS2962463.1 glycosyltransferase [Actinocrinis puniceicyclus]
MTSHGPGMRIAAVATAYHPDDRLTAVVEAALETCSAVVVVDNTPGTDPTVADKLPGLGAAEGRVKVLRSGENVGLAAALNLGVRELPDDAQAVLLLDQDSVLPGEMVTALAGHLDDPTVGIAAPTPWDAAHDSSYDNLAALRAEVADRTDVITSGMLIRRGALDRVGPFREDFFVDFVDIDFCLRLRRAGLRIVQDQRLKLPHSLGDRRPHRLGPLRVQVVHYPAWRLYWIARGAATLLRENLRREPLWSVKAVLFLGSWTWRTAAFEDGRVSHLAALLRGARDGLLRRVSLRYLPEGATYRAAR